MIHNASIHRPAGHWPEDKAVGTLTLDYDARQNRELECPLPCPQASVRRGDEWKRCVSWFILNTGNNVAPAPALLRVHTSANGHRHVLRTFPDRLPSAAWRHSASSSACRSCAYC